MTGHVLTGRLSAGRQIDLGGARWTGEHGVSAASQRLGRSVAGPLIAAAAYFVGAHIGFALQSPLAPQSLLWLPNSIVLSILLVQPADRWPRYLLAAFPAQLLVALETGAPVGTMALLYLTNCADAVIGALIVHRLTGGPRTFGTLRTMLAFVAFAAVLSPVALSFADAAITVLTGWGADYWAAFETRVRSNVLTHLVVVPALVTALAMPRSAWRAIPARRYAEALAVLAGLLITSGFAFDRLLAPDARPIHSLPAPFILPFLLWLAVRFGPGMTAAGLLVIAFVASWGVTHATGAVATLWVAETIGALQFFLTAMVVPLLCLAAVISERATAALALGESRERVGELAAGVLAAQETAAMRLATLEEKSRHIAHMGRLAATGQLSAALSHELRQPLSAIRTNAQAGIRFLASDAPPLGELRAILEDIVADDARAESVIERIRALLRNEIPRMDPVDLNDVCRSVELLARADAMLHETRLEVDLDPMRPTVLGDSIQLQQVVLNLVLNALDAAVSSDGERMVSVTTSRSTGMAEIAVRDSGRGVPPDVRGHVFEAFFSTKPQGLGMGLTIVRSIVDRHRGSIHVENAADGGAIFVVTLPAEDPTPAPG